MLLLESFDLQMFTQNILFKYIIIDIQIHSYFLFYLVVYLGRGFHDPNPPPSKANKLLNIYDTNKK